MLTQKMNKTELNTFRHPNQKFMSAYSFEIFLTMILNEFRIENFPNTKKIRTVSILDLAHG